MDDGNEVDKIFWQINHDICQKDLTDVQKVTRALVNQAVNRLKNGKADSVYDFSSDCLKKCFGHPLSAFLKHFSNFSNPQSCKSSSFACCSCAHCQRQIR